MFLLDKMSLRILIMCPFFLCLFIPSLLFILLLTPVLQLNGSIPAFIVANELDLGGKLAFELTIKRIDYALKCLFLLGVISVSLEQSFMN